MKMTITIEEDDIRQYIAEMLKKSGLEPVTSDFKYDSETKTYVIDCKAIPVPDSKEVATAPESGVDQTAQTPSEDESHNDENETNEDETMSLEDLRSASATIERKGPKRGKGVQSGAEAHAALADASSKMDGESALPPQPGEGE
jgi:hypothetical protein